MKHRFASPITDGGNNQLVRPSNWNDTHVLGTVFISANTVLTTASDTIFASGTIALTLPDATTCSGQPYLFKNVGNGIITVTPVGGQTIDGGSNSLLNITNETLAIVSDGANWRIISTAYLALLGANNHFTGNNTFSYLDAIVMVDGTVYPLSVAGIAAAVTALGSSPGWIILSPGAYSDDGTTTITISNARQHIHGGGKWATQINCNSARAVPVFKFSAGASVLYQCSIGGFGMAGAGTSQKTGILLQDTSEMYIHDIAIQTWTGSTSIGINFQGRELCQMARMSIVADNPIQINPNPNFSISLDATHFQDLYLLPSSGQYGITFGANVSITRLVWDGSNTVAGGAGPINWNETHVGGVTSGNIYIANVTHEQGTTPSAYSFDFQRVSGSASLQFLTMVNCAVSPNQNGFRFQNTNGVTLISPQHSQAGGTALSADSTNYDLVILNPFFQTGSTITNNASNAGYGGSITAPTINTQFLNSGYIILSTGSPTVTSGQLGIGTTQTPTASGGAATLPGNPVGFLEWNFGGTNIKIPYYAA